MNVIVRLAWLALATACGGDEGLDEAGGTGGSSQVAGAGGSAGAGAVGGAGGAGNAGNAGTAGASAGSAAEGDADVICREQIACGYQLADQASCVDLFELLLSAEDLAACRACVEAQECATELQACQSVCTA